MEEITLLRDFAVIMVVAALITLLFRKLRQPLVLGYIIAGIIVGPYMLPFFSVDDIHNIRLLADLGLILILFCIGLEFSWSKIRNIGFTILIIGIIEIVTMISLGYGLGKMLGWPERDSIFLGAALHISSSAIIIKLFRDMGWLQRISSKIVVGMLVVEDFAAVLIIAVLSGFSGSAAVDLNGIGLVLLKIVIFTITSLVLGAVIIRRIIKFTGQFHSSEALLITSLGLCFAMALFGKYLGLSVAIGAFLMGALIGDTESSEDVVRVLAPVRYMFSALFFIAIGMLIDLSQFHEYAVPAIIVAFIFIFGKIFINTIMTFLSGQNSRTALQVGMSMPQMGEFSLVITRVGVENKVVMPNLYPIIALVTALTAFTSPYITRSADFISDYLDNKSPQTWKTYISRLTEWLRTIRLTFSSDSVASVIIRHAIRSIVINLIIIVIVISIGTFILPMVTDIASFTSIRSDFVGLIIGCLLLLFCLPSFFVIFKNVRNLADYAVTYLLSRRMSARSKALQAMRVIFRDSIFILLVILVALWFIPFMLSLFSIGSFAMAVPAVLIVLFLGTIIWSAFDIHSQIERTFSKALIGKELVSSSQGSRYISVPGKILNWLLSRFKPFWTVRKKE